MPTLNMIFSVAITLEVTTHNNLSKSQKFSREISVDFDYSETIVFGIHSNFTYDSKTYDIVKLNSDNLKSYLSLDSSLLFNVNHLIYCILIKIYCILIIINILISFLLGLISMTYFISSVKTKLQKSQD